MGGKDQEARVVEHGGEGGGLGGVASKNVNDPLCNSFPFFLLGKLSYFHTLYGTPTFI